MTTKVLVPLLGEGVEEVTVTKWLKQEGEAIKELEPLLEVNTDKVDTEIPAPASGTILKIVAPEGRPARVGGAFSGCSIRGGARRSCAATSNALSGGRGRFSLACGRPYRSRTGDRPFRSSRYRS